MLFRSVGKADKEQQLSLISVNLDPSEALFREIIRRDGLSESSQWHVEGPQAGRISDAYNLRHGLSSFLIDPEGRIIAVNPDREQLKAALAAG